MVEERSRCQEQGAKDPRTRGGYLSSPSCPFSLCLFFFVTFFGLLFFSWVGGGGQGLVFNPGAFTNYFGPREVFITRAFFNPIWTLDMIIIMTAGDAEDAR